MSLLKVKWGGNSYLCKWEPDNYVEIGGRKYPVVKIGTLYWISENLDYIDEQFYTTYNQFEPTALKINGHDEYGKYYNYYGRQRIRDILPEGWRVQNRAILAI